MCLIFFFQSCSKIEGGKKMSEFSRGGQRGVWITHVGSFMFIGTTLNSALYWLAVPRNESNDIPVFKFLALIVTQSYNIKGLGF